MQYTYGGTPADVLTDRAGNVIPDYPVIVRAAGTGQQITALYETDGTTPIGQLRSNPDGDDQPGAIRAFRIDDVTEIEYEYTGTSGEPVRWYQAGREVAQEALTTAQAALPRPATAGRDGDALLLGANGQPVWGRLTSGTVSPWAALEAAPAPRWIAHRGAALLAPENTIESFRAASALNADAIELDVYKVADGGLFVMHDTTVDRTSNISGSTAQLTTPAALRGRIDAGAWFANSWPNDLRIPLFADALAEIGNQIPIIVHCNNAGSGAAAVAEIQRQELDAAVLIMAWNETELAAARAARIPTLLLDSDGILPSQTYEGLLAAGTQYLGVDVAQASAATIQAAAAAGMRVCVYTVNRRREFYTQLPKDGSVWAVISDDPWYVRGTGPMRTTDLFGAGTFFHGMPGITDAGDYRGYFQQSGSTAWFGLDTSGSVLVSNLGYASVLQGYLGPLPNAFTLDFDFVIDAADYASASLQVAFTVSDGQYDDEVTGTLARQNGYNILMRSNGTIDIYRVVDNTPTSIGSLATAAIAAGTTQHLRVQMTGTQIIVTRTNIAAPNSLAASDVTYRTALYPHFGVRDTKTRWSKVAVTG